ncbi:MAG: pyruvate ferredoxin oxidoreductase [Methanosarcinales archaeon]|nr:MAG: pyruvate ferredoxin oxidoreductase [Methanosarcinales archaeon]
MSTIRMIAGNGAAAWGARLARVEIIPNFPITPQTAIIEEIASWIASGEMDADFLPMESEHSVQSALAAASSAGTRVFSATSSQGLLLMTEMMFVTSGLRLPVIMVNVSRGLSAPITLWSDHNDVLVQRDSGWLQIFCSNNQEVLDSVVMGYKIAENNDVLLPMMINLDGFTLSATREPVDIPGQDEIDGFLPEYNPKHTILDPKEPMSMGGAVFDEYMYFRSQQRMAMQNSKGVIKDVCAEWEKITGRNYGLVESYCSDDSARVLVICGSESAILKYTVDKLRAKGEKVGMLRLRAMRPFPCEEIIDALSRVEEIGVIDQDISPGSGGIIATEVKACLGRGVTSFIAGLGGRRIGAEKYEKIFGRLGRDVEEWIF